MTLIQATTQAVILAFILSACAEDGPDTKSADGTGQDAAQISGDHEEDGKCWAHETLPVIDEETLTDGKVEPAKTAEGESATKPPVSRVRPVKRSVREQTEISFEAPCPDQITKELLSTLQRALAARGYYDGDITGKYDDATAAAVKTYQSERGLESDQLSLQTARDLGVIAIELPSRDNG